MKSRSIRNLLLIAQREYLATVKSKAFIISLVLAPLFMGGSIIAMVLFQDKVDTRDKKIAIIDSTGQIAPAIIEKAEHRNANNITDKEGKQNKPAYLFHIVEAATEELEETRLELSDDVRNRKLFGFVEIADSILSTDPKVSKETPVRFYSKNPSLDDLRGWIRGPINDAIRGIHLSELGIDKSEVGYLFEWHRVDGMKLVEADESGKAKDAEKANELAAFGIPVAMLFIMFIMVMMGAMPLLNSVMEEKNQHIAETILCSVTPFQFMLGKVLGGVAVSLTGSAFYITMSVLLFGNMGFMGYIPFELIPWFLVYLIGAIMLMGSMMAAIGSACADAKEAQNYTFPAMLPIMVPMFVLSVIIKEPMSGFATTLSLIPPFTPMLMMLRQSMPGGVPMWQPMVGLAGLFIFTVITVWVGSRIFRVGILMKGKTPSFSTMMKWAIKG